MFTLWTGANVINNVVAAVITAHRILHSLRAIHISELITFSRMNHFYSRRLLLGRRFFFLCSGLYGLTKEINSV